MITTAHTKSSILNQFTFFKKRFYAHKKYLTQQKRFLPLRSLCAQKAANFVVFCSLIFVLLVCFCLRVFLWARNFSVKKKKLIIVSTASITYTTTLNRLSKIYVYTLIFICDHLWTFFYENLFESLNPFLRGLFLNLFCR